MNSFSQRNPEWARARLGESDLTIGRFGCTTTCIANLSSYFKDDLNPIQISQRIKYTPGGLVIWASCIFPSFVFERREVGRNDEEIMKALLDPKRAVILNVANGSHWVVAIGGGPTLRIADPWLGDRSTMARYKNDITGAAYFKRNA